MGVIISHKLKLPPAIHAFLKAEKVEKMLISQKDFRLKLQWICNF